MLSLLSSRKLGETLQEFSQNLAIWTSLRMLLEQIGNWKMASLFSEVLNFALTKAGKDSMFFIYPNKFVIKDRERLSNCRIPCHFEAVPLKELDARLRVERISGWIRVV